MEKIRRYTLRPVCRRYRTILACRFGGTDSSDCVNSGFDRLTSVDDVDMLDEREDTEFFSVITTTCLSLPFSISLSNERVVDIVGGQVEIQ